MDLIIDNLFLGERKAAISKHYLLKNGVTHILTVAKNQPPKYPELFKYKVVSISDEPESKIRVRFPECMEFIKDAIS